MSIAVSDHALLRFLERAGALDVAGLRENLAASLERAHSAARSVSRADYLIQADGLIFVVRGEVVTTVIEQRNPGASARALENDHS